MRTGAALSDGDTLPLSHLTVSATENPITDERTFSPGSVSSQGGLIYGLDFAAKEADELSAEHIVFSQPLSLCVEEFAGMVVQALRLRGAPRRAASAGRRNSRSSSNND